MRLRSWLEQNADSGGSMNAKSHITTFKWRHINAFPVQLSSNNSLEQCAVHAHEIVFFSREAWTVLPWRAFWIGVLNQRFKTLILPSQNKHERSLLKTKLAVFQEDYQWGLQRFYYLGRLIYPVAWVPSSGAIVSILGLGDSKRHHGCNNTNIDTRYNRDTFH